MKLIENPQFTQANFLQSLYDLIPAANRKINRLDKKLSETVSVSEYGAVGNGVTDDTAAIEATSLAAGVNGTLFFPAGFNCLVSSEVSFGVAGQKILGQGAKLTKAASFTGSCMIRVSAANVTIEGLELDGTDQLDDGVITSAGVAAGFRAIGMRVYNCLYGLSPNSNSDITIDGCVIDECAAYPIRVHNIAAVAVNDNIRVTNNKLDQTSQDPATSTQVCLLVRGDASFPSTNVHISGNTFLHVSDPTASGALCCEMRFVDGGVFSDNTATGGGMMISVAASSNVQVVGNTGIGQTFYSVEVASISSVVCTDVSVVGNTIRGNGILNYAVGLQGNAAGCTGAVVSGNAMSGMLKYGVFSNDVWDDIVVSGNRISYSDADTSQYGVYFLGTTTRTIENFSITGNTIHGGGVGEKAIHLVNCSVGTVSGNTCPGWSENGVYISVSATVTVDNIAINGNSLTPVGAGAVGKTVSGTMGNRVTARGNSGLRLSNTVATDILNFNLDVYEACGTGDPESLVTAGVSSVFRRSDGGAATCLYVKESGTGDTGWVAK